MRPVVQVRFSNGFGNNLFQYNFARLLAKKHNGLISIGDGFNQKGKPISEFSKLGIELRGHEFPEFPIKKVNDSNASRDLFSSKFDNTNFSLNGYFEDYSLFSKDIDLIKTWYPQITKHFEDDLVFHLRLGDRLFYKNSYFDGMKVSPESYVKAIKQFSFNKLHVVTDMKKWDKLDIDSLSKMKFHTGGKGGSRIIGSKIGIADPQIAIDYFNSIYDAIEGEFNPTVRVGMGIADDFKYMRNFDQILFQHGTLAWWASVLSSATRVGVYGPWRPCKKKKNKNLSKVNLNGWFTWE